MRSKAFLATALACCSLSFAQLSQAGVIYDFMGTGQFCTYLTNGSLSCQNDVDFTGTITLDVIGVPDDIGEKSARGNNWVSSAFEIFWGGRSHRSFSVIQEGETGSTRNPASVQDNFDFDGASSPQDGLFNTFRSSSSREGIERLNYFQLIRFTSDTSWLSSLDFVEALGLAPIPTGGSGLNRIFFEYYILTETREGFLGQNIFLTSMQARTTAVPEPGTLALLGLGLLGLGLSRRKKLN